MSGLDLNTVMQVVELAAAFETGGASLALEEAEQQAIQQVAQQAFQGALSQVGAQNQSLLSKLGSPAGGFNQILYQMAASSNSANLFYRANGGTNNALGAYCPLCTATGSYNEVTGLGSPNVANMVAYLGGKVPATAAVSALGIDRLGKPAYKMTRRMLQEQRKIQLPATQTIMQQALPQN